MIISPYSLNGTLINDGVTYKAYIDQSQTAGAPPVRVSFIRRPGAWPVYAGKEFQSGGIWLTIDTSPNSTTDGFMAKFEALNALLDLEGEEPMPFIIQDSSDSDTQYTINVIVDGAPQFGNSGADYSVRLAFENPVWQSVLQNTSTFSIVSATDSTTITNNGNADGFPVIEVTPGTGAGWQYSRASQVLPSSGSPWPGRAVSITSSTNGDTFDTAALIAALKMQASSDPGGACGDIRVLRDGTETDFWIAGANSTDTKIWVVADMPAQSNMVLGTAISATDSTSLTEIVLKNDTANKTLITALPTSGRVIVDAGVGSTDTEEFTYTAKTVTANKLSFTINARGVRNTDRFAHAANSIVRFLPYDFTILYGNLTCEAADVSNTRKPALDLTNSNNGTLVWDVFYDEAAQRSMVWTPAVRKVSYPALSQSDVFTSTGDDGDTDPATAMGIKGLPYQNGALWKADTMEIAWLINIPDQITSIAASGEQTQYGSTRPSFTLISRKVSGGAMTTLWGQAVQSATDYSTWTAWSKASTDTAAIPVGTTFVEFTLKGTTGAASTSFAKVAVLETTIVVTNAPTVILRSEFQDFRCDFTIFNVTADEYLRVSYPVALGTILYIDCDPDFPTAKYNGQIVNGSIQVDSPRPYWFRLRPGDNVIGYESNLGAASSISIAFKWYDRMIFQ